MAAYSFLDLTVAISGPNGNFTLGGDGAANSEEGCTFAFKEERNIQTMGAAGEAMNSLRASRAGKATFRYLKTSPINALLATLYFADSSVTATWGVNTITARQGASGDDIICSGCALSKFSDVKYAVDGGTMEWEFDVAQMSPLLAAGIPGLTA